MGLNIDHHYIVPTVVVLTVVIVPYFLLWVYRRSCWNIKPEKVDGEYKFQYEEFTDYNADTGVQTAFYVLEVWGYGRFGSGPRWVYIDVFRSIEEIKRLVDYYTEHQTWNSQIWP